MTKRQSNITRVKHASTMSHSFFTEFPFSPALHTYLKENHLHILHKTGQHLNPNDLNNCVALCRNNMMTIYNKSQFASVGTSSIGWDDCSKTKELVHPDAHILYIVREHDMTSNNTPDVFQGFIHIRFEAESSGIAVLYIYELQLHSNIIGQGLGQLLMNYIEDIAYKTHMDKLMCTVQLANPKAIHFYKNYCHFLVDITSPTIMKRPISQQKKIQQSHTHSSPIGYEILSKIILY